MGKRRTGTRTSSVDPTPSIPFEPREPHPLDAALWHARAVKAECETTVKHCISGRVNRLVAVNNLRGRLREFPELLQFYVDQIDDGLLQADRSGSGPSNFGVVEYSSDSQSSDMDLDDASLDNDDGTSTPRAAARSPAARHSSVPSASSYRALSRERSVEDEADTEALLLANDSASMDGSVGTYPPSSFASFDGDAIMSGSAEDATDEDDAPMSEAAENSADQSVGAYNSSIPAPLSIPAPPSNPVPLPGDALSSESVNNPADESIGAHAPSSPAPPSSLAPLADDALMSELVEHSTGYSDNAHTSASLTPHADDMKMFPLADDPPRVPVRDHRTLLVPRSNEAGEATHNPASDVGSPSIPPGDPRVFSFRFPLPPSSSHVLQSDPSYSQTQPTSTRPSTLSFHLQPNDHPLAPSSHVPGSALTRPQTPTEKLGKRKRRADTEEFDAHPGPVLGVEVPGILPASGSESLQGGQATTHGGKPPQRYYAVEFRSSSVRRAAHFDPNAPAEKRLRADSSIRRETGHDHQVPESSVEDNLPAVQPEQNTPDAHSPREGSQSSIEARTAELRVECADFEGQNTYMPTEGSGSEGYAEHQQITPRTEAVQPLAPSPSLDSTQLSETQSTIYTVDPELYESSVSGDERSQNDQPRSPSPSDPGTPRGDRSTPILPHESDLPIETGPSGTSVCVPQQHMTDRSLQPMTHEQTDPACIQDTKAASSDGMDAQERAPSGRSPLSGPSFDQSDPTRSPSQGSRTAPPDVSHQDFDTRNTRVPSVPRSLAFTPHCISSHPSIPSNLPDPRPLSPRSSPPTRTSTQSPPHAPLPLRHHSSALPPAPVVASPDSMPPEDLTTSPALLAEPVPIHAPIPHEPISSTLAPPPARLPTPRPSPIQFTAPSETSPTADRLVHDDHSSPPLGTEAEFQPSALADSSLGAQDNVTRPLASSQRQLHDRATEPTTMDEYIHDRVTFELPSRAHGAQHDAQTPSPLTRESESGAGIRPSARDTFAGFERASSPPYDLDDGLGFMDHRANSLGLYSPSAEVHDAHRGSPRSTVIDTAHDAREIYASIVTPPAPQATPNTSFAAPSDDVIMNPPILSNSSSLSSLYTNPTVPHTLPDPEETSSIGRNHDVATTSAPLTELPQPRTWSTTAEISQPSPPQVIQPPLDVDQSGTHHPVPMLPPSRGLREVPSQANDSTLPVSGSSGLTSSVVPNPTAIWDRLRSLVPSFQRPTSSNLPAASPSQSMYSASGETVILPSAPVLPLGFGSRPPFQRPQLASRLLSTLSGGAAPRHIAPEAPPPTAPLTSIESHHISPNIHTSLSSSPGRSQQHAWTSGADLAHAHDASASALRSSAGLQLPRLNADPPFAALDNGFVPALHPPPRGDPQPDQVSGRNWGSTVSEEPWGIPAAETMPISTGMSSAIRVTSLPAAATSAHTQEGSSGLPPLQEQHAPMTAEPDPRDEASGDLSFASSSEEAEVRDNLTGASSSPVPAVPETRNDVASTLSSSVSPTRENYESERGMHDNAMGAMSPIAPAELGSTDRRASTSSSSPPAEADTSGTPAHTSPSSARTDQEAPADEPADLMDTLSSSTPAEQETRNDMARALWSSVPADDDVPMGASPPSGPAEPEEHEMIEDTMDTMSAPAQNSHDEVSSPSTGRQAQNTSSPPQEQSHASTPASHPQSGAEISASSYMPVVHPPSDVQGEGDMVDGSLSRSSPNHETQRLPFETADLNPDSPVHVSPDPANPVPLEQQDAVSGVEPSEPLRLSADSPMPLLDPDADRRNQSLPPTGAATPFSQDTLQARPPVMGDNRGVNDHQEELRAGAIPGPNYIHIDVVLPLVNQIANVAEQLGNVTARLDNISANLNNSGSPSHSTNSRGTRQRRGGDGIGAGTNDDGYEADAETAVRPPPRPRRSRRSLPRPADQNELADNVREHVRLLCGIPVSGVIPASVVPSTREVNAWDPNVEAATTAEANNFKLDLNGFPKSNWNRSACEGFVQSFLDSRKYVCRDVERIEDSFYAHIATLRKRWNDQRVAKESRERKEKQNRRQMRKRNLFKRRLDTLQGLAQTLRHARMLEQFGHEGMSSDETDSQDKTRYNVFLKPWRNPLVQNWLRVIDQLYLVNRQNTRQGSMPRPRNATGIESTSKTYVTYLPINAYAPLWVTGLGDIQRAGLMATSAEYDFSFDLAVMQAITPAAATPATVTPATA